MNEKVLGLERKEVEKTIKYLEKEEKRNNETMISTKEVIITLKGIFKQMIEQQVPAVSVKKVEKVIKQRPCKSCEYFTDWLKELKY